MHLGKDGCTTSVLNSLLVYILLHFKYSFLILCFLTSYYHFLVSLSPLIVLPCHRALFQGMSLVWESYKLDPYVQRLAECVFNFQEKVRTYLWRCVWFYQCGESYIVKWGIYKCNSCPIPFSCELSVFKTYTIRLQRMTLIS